MKRIPLSINFYQDDVEKMDEIVAKSDGRLNRSTLVNLFMAWGLNDNEKLEKLFEAQGFRKFKKGAK